MNTSRIAVLSSLALIACTGKTPEPVTPPPAGVVKTFELSAEYDLFEDPRYGRVDRGGCLNALTPCRPQVKNTEGMGSNSCLVEIERWTWAREGEAGPACANARPRVADLSARRRDAGGVT